MSKGNLSGSSFKEMQKKHAKSRKESLDLIFDFIHSKLIDKRLSEETKKLTAQLFWDLKNSMHSLEDRNLELSIELVKQMKLDNHSIHRKDKRIDDLTQEISELRTEKSALRETFTKSETDIRLILQEIVLRHGFYQELKERAKEDDEIVMLGLVIRELENLATFVEYRLSDKSLKERLKSNLE